MIALVVAAVVLLGVTVFASSIVAYREVQQHNDYLKEVKMNAKNEGA